MKFATLRQNNILQAIFVVALGYILWRLRTLVIIIFLAFLGTTIIYPMVGFLKKHRWPTVFAVLSPIIGIFLILALLFYLVLPPFIHQLHHFVTNLPVFLNTASSQFHLSLNTSSLSDYIKKQFGGLGSLAISFTTRAITLLAGVITIFMMTVYWLGSYEKIKAELLSYPRGEARRRMEDIWNRIEFKLRRWIRAHLILNTVVGALVFGSMSLLHVPFAGVLALIAFLVEIIPTAGPIIAALPAVILGLSESVAKGLIVALTYTIIQQIESHILSPLLLGKTVNLHALVIIISILIGYEAYGIFGSLIAVPVALCVSAAVDSYKEWPKAVPASALKKSADAAEANR